ncbi:Scn10a [Symbiodinium sp. KB8]|nr:Scn10a [Symbiodinium sp. KB8]
MNQEDRTNRMKSGFAYVAAISSCALYCLNGELLQALQRAAPGHHASPLLNLALCHLGGLLFVPHFGCASTSEEPAGQCSAAFAGVRAALSQRPRLAALPFALLLMGYNYAWLLSASFIDLRLTNAVFQVSTALVYIASVQLFGEAVCLERLLGVLLSLGGSFIASGLKWDDASSTGPRHQHQVVGFALALTAAVGYTAYQVLFRWIFGHLKQNVSFLAHFFSWISLWHLLIILPLVLAAHAAGIEQLQVPHGLFALAGTAVSALIASTVNVLYLCIVMWGSPMLLPSTSALSVPLTVVLDIVIHNERPEHREMVGSGTEAGKAEPKQRRKGRKFHRQGTTAGVYTEKDLKLKGDGVVAAVAYSGCFLNVALVAIVLNALWMLIDTEWNHVNLRGSDGRRPLQDVSGVVENLFCSFFSIEILIRFFGFKRWRFMFEDSWFLFDALLVILMVLETWILPLLSEFDSRLNSDALDNVKLIRLFRMLRLGRIFRILRFHPEMRLLVKSIARAMNAVFNILFLLVLVTYLFAIIFTSQLAKPGTKTVNVDLDEAEAKQLFANMVSSMLSLFTHGVLADELAFAFLVIKEDSVPLFWLFAVFVVFSGITLLNMLIGVLCQVVADNSREHEKNQILVDLKSSLEDAFEALDTSQDGIISEEEFKQMKTDPNVMEIFFRLGMEESAIIQRLDHMQETIFAVAKSDNADESFLTDSKDPASRRPPSMSFKQFTDQVVDLQMNTSAGVLDVQSVAAKVRAEDQKILTALSRLEPDLRRLLQAPMDAQEAKTLSSSRIQTLNLAGEDSTSVRPQSTHAACPGQASQASPAPRAEPLPDQSVHLPGSLESRGLQAETKVPEQASDKEAPELREDWLQEVPTELLLYILKARAGPDMIS